MQLSKVIHDLNFLLSRNQQQQFTIIQEQGQNIEEHEERPIHHHENVPYTQSQIDTDPIALANYFSDIVRSTEKIKVQLNSSKSKAQQMKMEAHDLMFKTVKELEKLTTTSTTNVDLFSSSSDEQKNEKINDIKSSGNTDSYNDSDNTKKQQNQEGDYDNFITVNSNMDKTILTLSNSLTFIPNDPNELIQFIKMKSSSHGSLQNSNDDRLMHSSYNRCSSNNENDNRGRSYNENHLMPNQNEKPREEDYHSFM